jgi:uncharacterized protein
MGRNHEGRAEGWTNFCYYNKLMLVEFDSIKRDRTLTERGLDFARAAEVFAGPLMTVVDERFVYGEERFLSFGLLDGRLVAIAWTHRGESRRVISMRNANAREKAKYSAALD